MAWLFRGYLGTERKIPGQLPSFKGTWAVIPGLRHDPKFCRVYDAKIVSDGIAEGVPLVRDVVAQEATIDTVTAHLAAAQGVPTWTLMRYAADWRYFDDKGHSRWYPSMRLFHQSRPGDIADAAAAMAQAWSGFRPAR